MIRLSGDIIRCLGEDGRDRCAARHQCARYAVIPFDAGKVRSTVFWCCVEKHSHFIQVTP